MPTRGPILAAGIVALVVVAHAGVARALPQRLSFSFGGDVTLAPRVDGNGIAHFNWDLGGLRRGGHLVLDYNTDTLRVALERFRFAGGRIEMGFDVRGEALLAGLLLTYMRDGETDRARGFFASWAAAGGYLKVNAAPHFVDVQVTARRWFFRPGFGTSPSLVLPDEAWVGEPRLHYTYWDLAPDPSLWEPHRWFPRVRGVAFGLEAGLNLRSSSMAWGARDVAAFAPVDLRNTPGRTIPFVHAWLRAGAQVHPRVRLQLFEMAGFLWNGDDLDRFRVGGANPYSVPLVGARWAGFLVDRFVSGEASLHVRAWRDLEVGALVDALYVDDRARGGAPATPAGLVGVGALLDWRVGVWQVDARAGWSPTVKAGDLAAFSVFVGAGFGSTKK